jgi:hypothetical protein
VSINRASPKELPSWSRLLEWSVLAGVIVVLGVVFARQVRAVQGQAELAAVKSTLGALRTAFVIDYSRKHTKAGTSALVPTQLNPFELLENNPVNYRGAMTAVEAAKAPMSGWVFDPVCVCVGYLPLDDLWFDSPSGDVMAWYQVSGAPGPLQLTAKEAYVWQGKVVN